jgi:hypothetical protein
MTSPPDAVGEGGTHTGRGGAVTIAGDEEGLSHHSRSPQIELLLARAAAHVEVRSIAGGGEGWRCHQHQWGGAVPPPEWIESRHENRDKYEGERGGLSFEIGKLGGSHICDREGE